MSDRNDQLNMPHTLTAYFLFRNFYTTTITNNALVTYTFIFSTMTFIIFYRSEYTFTEQTVPLRFICTVIDGFWFQDFTARPFKNFFRRSQTYGNLRKVTLYLVLIFLKAIYLIYKALSELEAPPLFTDGGSLLLFYYSKVILRPRPLNSCNNTLRDSGIPGVGIGSPLTIAS